MKIIQASYQIENPDLSKPEMIQEIYRQIEAAGRTCYVSENAMIEGSGEKFVRKLIQSGHDAMLEHAFMRVRFIVDRGISHELVRHRVASFAQESTRYCNYSKDKFGNEITVIEPCFFKDIPEEEKREIREKDGYWLVSFNVNEHHAAYAAWHRACTFAEQKYFSMLQSGCTPQEARAVLPHSLKTQVVMTANMREWRHFLKLRAAGITGKPHPQMVEVAEPLLMELREKLPALFEDILPMNSQEKHGV